METETITTKHTRGEKKKNCVKTENLTAQCTQGGGKKSTHTHTKKEEACGNIKLHYPVYSR